jgi:hypothetical protein
MLPAQKGEAKCGEPSWQSWWPLAPWPIHASAVDVIVFGLKTTSDLLAVCTTPESDAVHKEAIQASIPDPAGGQSVAVGTLVNEAPWTIVIYLNQDPDAPGAPPLTFLAPASSFRIAFRPGQHLLVARSSPISTSARPISASTTRSAP